MSILSPLEHEVAELIVEALDLEDTKATDIEPDMALFRDGLALDSIDALELALAISKKYGFQIKSSDEDNVRIFASLRTLSKHIEVSRTQ